MLDKDEVLRSHLKMQADVYSVNTIFNDTDYSWCFYLNENIEYLPSVMNTLIKLLFSHNLSKKNFYIKSMDLSKDDEDFTDLTVWGKDLDNHLFFHIVWEASSKELSIYFRDRLDSELVASVTFDVDKSIHPDDGEGGEVLLNYDVYCPLLGHIIDITNIEV